MLSDRNTPEEQRPLITGSFDRDSAERAYDDLRRRGYSEKEIHLLMSDETRKRHFSGKHDQTDLGNKALEGAGVGGAAGGVIGATLTAIAAAGATLAVPGVGLVIAGPLAGALAGGATGAAAGGLIGTLIGMGIPEDRAKRYERDLKEGHIVMGVNPRNDEDASYFQREWEPAGQNLRRQ
jgi:hypothetical protein